MTTLGKVSLISGLTALGAGAAYYFFIYRPGRQNATAAAANIAQAISAIAPKPSAYEGKVIRAGSNIRVYLVKDGVKHLFTSPEALSRAGFTFGQVVSLPQDVVDAIPTGSNLNGVPRNLLR
jgi:hypothetical protein